MNSESQNADPLAVKTWQSPTAAQFGDLFKAMGLLDNSSSTEFKDGEPLDPEYLNKLLRNAIEDHEGNHRKGLGRRFLLAFALGVGTAWLWLPGLTALSLVFWNNIRADMPARLGFAAMGAVVVALAVWRGAKYQPPFWMKRRSGEVVFRTPEEPFKFRRVEAGAMTLWGGYRQPDPASLRPATLWLAPVAHFVVTASLSCAMIVVSQKYARVDEWWWVLPASTGLLAILVAGLGKRPLTLLVSKLISSDGS